jgi:hypothetical protein
VLEKPSPDGGVLHSHSVIAAVLRFKKSKSMPLSCNDLKLITDWGGEISWSEVFALHVSKLDAIERTLTILSFEYSNGHFIEVNADESGFGELKCNLANYLPLPADWYDQIESMPVTETLTLFDLRTGKN